MENDSHSDSRVNSFGRMAIQAAPKQSKSKIVDVCGSCGVIKESSPLRGRVRLTVNTRFR